MATLRKLYETHIDAQFIELDMTGQVAFRWTHWGVAERAKLRPDDEIAQRECAISKKMFENEKEFGRHGLGEGIQRPDHKALQGSSVTSSIRG
jgi:hypothetical protein